MSARPKPGPETADDVEPELEAEIGPDPAPDFGNSEKLLLTAQRTELGRVQAIISQQTNRAPSQQEGNQPTPLQSQNPTTISGDEHETAVPEAIHNLFKDDREKFKQLVERAESAIKDADVQLVTLSSKNRIAFWNKAGENAKKFRYELQMFSLRIEQSLRGANEEWNKREAEIRKKHGGVSNMLNNLSEIEDSLDKRVLEGKPAENPKREREEDEEKTERQRSSKKTKIRFETQPQPQSEGRQ